MATTIGNDQDSGPNERSGELIVMNPFEIQGSRRKHAGFTVLEVLVTVAIVGLIASVALPSFSSLDEDRLETAAARVASTLRFARDQATSTRQYVGIEVFPAPETLQVFSFDMSVDPPVKNFTVLDPLTKAPLILNFKELGVALGDIEFENELDLVFTPDGTPTIPGDLAYLSAQSFMELKLGAMGRKITIDAVTGRIGIETI